MKLDWKTGFPFLVAVVLVIGAIGFYSGTGGDHSRDIPKPGSRSQSLPQIDSVRFAKPVAVLVIDSLQMDVGCDKYCWFWAGIVRVLKKPPEVTFDKRIHLAAYGRNYLRILPDSILYLGWYSSPGQEWEMIVPPDTNPEGKPEGWLNELEAYQEGAILDGMATAEQKFTDKKCHRFFICVNGSDPSPRIKIALKKNYHALHWCSERIGRQVREGCMKTVVNIQEPLSLPAMQYRFSIEANGKFNCRIPFDAGNPITAKFCTKEY